MDEVMLYILHTSLVKENYSFVLSFVDKKRIEKAERFVNEKDRLLCLGAGYLLKKYLPDEEPQTNENGKPYLLNGPCFNLSHSGEYVILGIHPSRDIGVDIERIDNNKLDAIKFVLIGEEKDITDRDSLFRIWTNKESFIKCTSKHLMDVRKISGLPLEGVRKDCYSKSMISNGYALSITLKGKDTFNISINNVTNLGE